MKALGMIEVRGFLGAVSAADAAVKAADVTLLKAEIIKGGLTTIELVGDVAAVNAATEAGVGAALALNCLITSHVISRVDEQTNVVLSAEETKPSAVAEPKAELVDGCDLNEESQETDFAFKEAEQEFSRSSSRHEELRSNRVADLRKQAYKMNLKSLKKNEIKSANKETLIQAIKAEIERSEDEWN